MIQPAFSRRRAPFTTGSVLAFTLAATLGSAQSTTSRPTVEAVVSGSSNAHGLDDPFLLFDVTGTGRLQEGLDVIVRPYAHRLPGGDWTFEMYQLQVRYTPPTRIPLRLDAGIIASPLGLNTLELLPSKNPTIGAPFFYFAPLPRFDTQFDGVQLISGGYPLGAIVTSSGTHWDARAGITDQSPTRHRNILDSHAPDAEVQLVAGGGYSPAAGARIGASVARGAFRKASTIQSTAAPVGDDATMVTVEGEYAIGYTRVTGEWIRDAFDATAGPAVARGFSLMATRTLTPRWFVAGRADRVSSPAITPSLDRIRRAASSGEATIGYRLDTDVSLRAGYQVLRWFGVPVWDHQLVVSAVWARRWN
jgi:hypothetical protein